MWHYFFLAGKHYTTWIDFLFPKTEPGGMSTGVRETLGNQLVESKRDSNTQKKHNGTIITWHWYQLSSGLVPSKPYFGINIFGQWYHYNLALVPSKPLPHAREIFQHIKWPNYPRLSPPRDSNGWTPSQAPGVPQMIIPASVTCIPMNPCTVGNCKGLCKDYGPNKERSIPRYMWHLCICKSYSENKPNKEKP